MASNHSMSKVAPADVEQMSSLADRIASLEKEVKTVRGSGHSAGNDEGGGDESPPESPYSWSFGALLDANASLWAQVASISTLYVMLFFQIFLCFAFADTSELMSDQGSYNLYATKVPMGHFYANTTAGVPTIQLVTGFLAIIILAVNVKDNCTVEALRSVYRSTRLSTCSSSPTQPTFPSARAPSCCSSLPGSAAQTCCP